jgi:hypothetical protein
MLTNSIKSSTRPPAKIQISESRKTEIVLLTQTGVAQK